MGDNDEQLNLCSVSLRKDTEVGQNTFVLVYICRRNVQQWSFTPIALFIVDWKLVRLSLPAISSLVWYLPARLSVELWYVPALLTNVRQGWKRMTLRITLIYSDASVTTVVKSFVIITPNETRYEYNYTMFS
jgi:hypothetical protein